jgi:hypothetical protein
VWRPRDLIPALRTPGRIQGHRLELFYGLASVLYWLVVQDWMEGILPDFLAAGLAWVLTGAVVVLAAVGVLGEIRGAA